MSESISHEPIPATLIPGDGIGPEITDAVVKIIDALGELFAWDIQEGGNAALAKVGDPLPPPLLDSIRRTRLALKGPLTTPVGGGFRSVNVRLREEFKLYANVRPAARWSPADGTTTSTSCSSARTWRGLYVGFEHYIPIDGDPHAAAISSGVNTRAGSRSHRIRARSAGGRLASSCTRLVAAIAPSISNIIFAERNRDRE